MKYFKPIQTFNNNWKAPRHSKVNGFTGKDGKTMKDVLQWGVRGGTKWETISRRYRKAYPICEKCKKKVSREVHHIVPLHIDNSDDNRYCWKGLMALCIACHHEIHDSPNSNRANQPFLSPYRRFHASQCRTESSPSPTDASPSRYQPPSV